MIIRHGQVGLAIAIEIPDRNGERVRPHVEVGGGVEGHRLSETDGDREKGRQADRKEPKPQRDKPCFFVRTKFKCVAAICIFCGNCCAVRPAKPQHRVHRNWD